MACAGIVIAYIAKPNNQIVHLLRILVSFTAAGATQNFLKKTQHIPFTYLQKPIMPQHPQQEQQQPRRLPPQQTWSCG